MSKTQMTGARMVVEALKDQGVEVVFGYPGGAVLPIYDEIFQQNEIRHIRVRHEQGAVHAAEGYARSTGKPGVVLVTSVDGAGKANIIAVGWAMRANMSPPVFAIGLGKKSHSCASIAASGEFIAVFDADFVPPPDILMQMVSQFFLILRDR